MIDRSSVTFFKTAAQFRRWLMANHARRTELWVGFYKKSSRKKGITYQEALDQALCFGWIDGILNRVDEDSYAHRFTPRKPKSNWSPTNIRRAGQLRKLGLMQPAGIAAFARRRKEEKAGGAESRAIALSPAYERKLRADRRAWAFFQSQTPSYRRLASSWVMGAKKEETRLRRLAALIEDSACGLKVKPLRLGGA